ncbi:hypothetical protein V500_06382 [Pseudogymnoascus sp. VKM F-4518 (FW-2643)]|nr:hypothetical protein V500_06382 [Pseudogymnoascus sp. VKM F-4518 (FW-2643)]
MVKFSIISSVLALLAVGASASAVPAPVDELIPSPGLPSLESLGLTRKDLLAMGRVKSLSPAVLIYLSPILTAAIVPESYNAHRIRGALLSGKRAVGATIPTCEDNYELPKKGAQVCINFLSALGSKACAVSGKFVQQMCTDHGASIMGANIKNQARVQSSCSDVAIAAQWIYDNCGLDTTDMNAGAHFAHGNGDLLISIVPA